MASELASFSGRSRVTRVELIRSHLDPAGARYETLWQVELAAS
jgi:2'-5' RNA ligase